MLRTPFVLRRLRNFTHQYNEVFSQTDILLSPVFSHAAPKLGYLGPDVPFKTVRDRLKNFVPFTFVQNISGAPMGLNQNGLPLGVQFAAAIGQERRLIELAFEIEEARPWPRIEEN